MSGAGPTLEAHPFLAGLEPEHQHAIASHAALQQTPAGSMLGTQSATADAGYLLVTGRVAIEAHSADRGQVPIQTLDEGDVLGWSWLVPPHIWRFDARAVRDVSAWRLDGKGLREAVAQDESLHRALLQRLVPVIVDRLEHTRLQLLRLHD